MKYHEKDPYHLSMEDLDLFCDTTTYSKYKPERIALIGGEPLMWKNIVEGTFLLVSTFPKSEIIMTTNALLMKEENLNFIEMVADHIDFFRISRYFGNEENIEFALKHFPSQVKVVDHRNRRFLPASQIVPWDFHVDCDCPGFTICGDQISYCSPMRTMGHLHPIAKEDTVFSWITKKVEMYYMNFFPDVYPYQLRSCRSCIGNKNLRKYCIQVPNIVK